MSTGKFIIVLFLWSIFGFGQLKGQDLSDTSTINFFDEVKPYELAEIFMANSFIVDEKRGSAMMQFSMVMIIEI